MYKQSDHVTLAFLFQEKKEKTTNMQSFPPSRGKPHYSLAPIVNLR
jgi:hypothetical protein